MANTIEQQIAEAEARLARLKERARKAETGQKIIVGGWVLNQAKHNQKVRDWLVKGLEDLQRPVDKERAALMIEQLRAISFPETIQVEREPEEFLE